MYAINMALEVKLFIWRVMIYIYANYRISVRNTIMYTTNMDLEVKLFIWRVMICIYANSRINLRRRHNVYY